METTHLNAILEKGIHAPSGDNWQPWQFRIHAENVDLYIVERPKLPFFEAGNWSRYLSAGAVIENIEIAASHFGYSLQVNYFPNPVEPLCVARLAFNSSGSGASQDDSLFRAIDTRVTNRKQYQPEKCLPPDIYKQLTDAVAAYGVSLSYIEHNDQTFTAYASLIGKAQELVFGTKPLFDEIANGVRYDPVRDDLSEGLDARTMELSPLQLIAMKLLSSSSTLHKMLIPLGGGWLTANYTEQQVRSSQAVLLLWAPDDKPLNNVMSGRALERVWLKLASLNISLQPMAATAVLARILKQPVISLLSEHTKSDIEKFNVIFNKTITVPPNMKLAMVARIGYAEPPTVRSARRPVANFILQP